MAANLYEITIEQPNSTVDVAAAGPQGIQGVQGAQGPAGLSLIGGYEIAISGLLNNDLLSYSSGVTKWVNRAAIDLTDGGNF